MVKITISRDRWIAFIEMRDSGRMNMWGYPDRDIIPNWDGLKEHFETMKKTEDYEVEKNDE